jgi:pSer/pThr/pTyr-binding forkhead associated (FHA) protein
LALVVTQGPRELRGIRLDLSDPILIGRDPDANLVIADGFVSSRHARVDPSERGPVLKDLGSTNGTVLNGKRLERPAVLSRGDTVELGKVVLEVKEL